MLWQNSVRVAGINFTNNSLTIFKCLTDIERFRLTGQLRTGTLKDFVDNILAYNLVKKVSNCTGRVSINIFIKCFVGNQGKTNQKHGSEKEKKKGCIHV